MLRSLSKLLIINTILLPCASQFLLPKRHLYTCICCLVSFAAPKKRSTYALLEPWLGETKKELKFLLSTMSGIQFEENNATMLMNHFTSLYYFIPEAWYELASSPGHASI